MTQPTTKIPIATKAITVQQTRNLTSTAYVLRFDRHQREFLAGQHVILSIKDENNAREYSVYSGENDDYFEVLIKEVLEGDVSRRLKKLKPGTQLQMDGPLGFFTLRPEEIDTARYMFIASGTGIAPFRSYVRSYPHLDYTLLHGVRYSNEAYEREQYHPDRYMLCTTGDTSGNFNGRVTDYLRQTTIDTATQYYLCGNVKMIHEAFEILAQKGVPTENMHAEVYF
jgi:ferredoxin--NADP+ reductase/benzoate/toluate 1,2-dioxygenase reductase subunit